MADFLAIQRAEFWKTQDEIDALDAKNAALIAELEKFLAETEPKRRDLEQRVKAAKAPRFELAQKLAFLAQGLGPNLGERPQS